MPLGRRHPVACAEGMAPENLENTVFPRVQFQERGDASDGILTYPYVGGWLLPDPMHNILIAGTSLCVVALFG